jgi:AraC-like DNA-binding protein
MVEVSVVTLDCRAQSSNQTYPVTVSMSSRSRLDAITDWVEMAKFTRYESAGLAKLCLVSPSQLRRYFMATLGKSPQRWLNELRLWHGAALLCSGLPLKQVAYELNFADQSHFCHRFKEYHGCTPFEFVLLYRQREKERIEWMRDCLSGNPNGEQQSPPPWEVAERNLCHKRSASSLSIDFCSKQHAADNKCS